MVPTVSSILTQVFRGANLSAPPEASSVEAVFSDFLTQVHNPHATNFAINSVMNAVCTEFSRLAAQTPIPDPATIPDAFTALHADEIRFIHLFEYFTPWTKFCLDLHNIEEDLQELIGITVLAFTAKFVGGFRQMPDSVNGSRMFSEMMKNVRTPPVLPQPVHERPVPKSNHISADRPYFVPPFHSLATPKSSTTMPHAHELLPPFAGFTGVISDEARLHAFQMANHVPKITPFTGVSDKRPLRRVLSYLKDNVQAHGLSPLVYSTLLDNSLSENIRIMVPNSFAHSYEDLILILSHRLDNLLGSFSGSLASEQSKCRSAYLNMRMRPKESLHEYVTRFETSLVDLKSVGRYPDSDSELISHFVCTIDDSLSSHAELCRSLYHCFGTFKTNLLGIAERAESRKSSRTARPQPATTSPAHGHPTPSKAAPSEARSCPGCGGNHLRLTCPHKDTICRSCGISGHVEKVCRKRMAAEKPDNPQQAHAIELQYACETTPENPDNIQQAHAIELQYISELYPPSLIVPTIHSELLVRPRPRICC